MPPKNYDLLNRVYGSSIYGMISNVQPEYKYDPVHSLVASLNMVIGNLDQYSEDEILEMLPKIERFINELPITEIAKTKLCDLLWDPKASLGTALHAITMLLSTVICVTDHKLKGENKS